MFHNLFFCLLLTAAVSYLLGSLNASIIASKLILKRDIRSIGSGNAGLTNSLRSGSKAVAVLTLLGDVLKVGAAVYFGGFLVTNCLGGDMHGSEWLLGAYVAGMCAQLGHVFPLYFGFKGGKGVLTLAAMMLFVDWKVFVITVVIFWGGMMLITRIVSLSALCAIPVYMTCTVIFAPSGSVTLIGSGVPIKAITIGVSLIMCIVVIIKHKDNIKRLLNGTESKIGSKG